MDSCNLLCEAIAGINWWWFAAATVVCVACGAFWYSFLFPKAWMRVFKVEPGEVNALSMVRTFGIQIAATLVYGFALWVLANLSVWIALIALVGFCAWEKGNLNFEFSRMKDFFIAAMIRVGYTFIGGLIFILFASI